MAKSKKVKAGIEQRSIAATEVLVSRGDITRWGVTVKLAHKVLKN